jgi:isopropylmalate/homocitrate/citramalate synthase
VAERALAAGLWLRGYVSTAFGCPYEGRVPVEHVVSVARRLFEIGAREVAVSDTIGVATPGPVPTVVGAVAAEIGLERVALHFHDTRGTALANVLAGLSLGIATYDSSAGGLGGCPYAPGATGNLATEDLLYMLHGLGIETGVSLDDVVKASQYLAEATGRSPASRYYQAASA